MHKINYCRNGIHFFVTPVVAIISAALTVGFTIAFIREVSPRAVAYFAKKKEEHKRRKLERKKTALEKEQEQIRQQLDEMDKR